MLLHLLLCSLLLCKFFIIQIPFSSLFSYPFLNIFNNNFCLLFADKIHALCFGQNVNPSFTNFSFLKLSYVYFFTLQYTPVSIPAFMIISFLKFKFFMVFLAYVQIINKKSVGLFHLFISWQSNFLTFCLLLEPYKKYFSLLKRQ